MNQTMQDQGDIYDPDDADPEAKYRKKLKKGRKKESKIPYKRQDNL